MCYYGSLPRGSCLPCQVLPHLLPTTLCPALCDCRCCGHAPPRSADLQWQANGPAVWQQLPREGLATALLHYDHDIWGDNRTAVHSLAAAAAEHSLHMDTKLQEEVLWLHATVAALTNQVDQQQKQHKAQVDELRATVAAVGAQLQSLLEQKELVDTIWG